MVGGRALAIAIASLVTACSPEPATAEVRLTGSIVEYGRTSGGNGLRGLLYLPPGAGPFPTLLYAHGSAPGSLNDAVFEAVAPLFTSRGVAVFAPYRRGQGLSRSAGPYIGDEIARARAAGGLALAQARLARLLATDHMDDQATAFAWLSRQRFADPRRIAVMGNSYGGIITLLSARRLPVCAAVDAAGAADSWKNAPAIRRLMTDAAIGAKASALFIQAANDFDLAPSRTLHAAMVKAGKPTRLRIYPAFGRTARDGHAFAYRGARIWADEVHAFVGRECPARPVAVAAA